MSLRARLLVGLVVLVAAGLTVAGVATYAAQRSFLYNRVDQQVTSAVDSISHRLGVVASPGGVAATGATGATGAGSAAGGGLYNAPPGFAGGFGTHPDGGDGGGPGGGGGGPPPGAFAPQGTFGERLSPAGKVIGTPVESSFSGETSGAAPSLPKHYPVTITLAHPHLFTASSAGGSGITYRVIAVASPDGSGTTIVAVPVTDVVQTLHRLLLVELLVAAVVLLALAALAWIVIGVGLRPLDRMGHVAEEIAGGDLSRRVTPATPRTEVGRLGLALNGMLVTIEQAFADRRASEDRLRRFLADASHELRTPLASIRGYAELFRLGAASDPEDLAKAMERIEAEAARMGILVEELLMLARLDELPETRTEPVQLAELAERAVADARAIAPERAIAMDGEAPPVAGDPDQLHQVLVNLLRNAISHTPAGTPIEVGLARDGERAVLTVRDHGPGLPDGVADRIFERFWRSDPGRSRGRGGAGLGLAIVQGIVHAHDGEVHAANAPGGGAVFSVLLPLAGLGGADADGRPPSGEEGSQPSLRGATG